MISAMAHDEWSVASIDNEVLRMHLQQNLGFHLESVNLDQILSGLSIQANEFESFEDYASAVASLIAVHETYFLRHPDQLAWLKTCWLPQWLAEHAHSTAPLRILSAGCATGEEPYSVAAALHSLLAQAGKSLIVEAVDISSRALAVAQRGHYGLWSLRGVDVHHEQSWLKVGARSVEVVDWVRNAVQFRQHNLTQPLVSAHQYDVIFCRNVLIYMHEAALAHIVKNLMACLSKNGILILGPSDPNPPADMGLQVTWQQGVRLLHRAHEQPVLPEKSAVFVAAHSAPKTHVVVHSKQQEKPVFHDHDAIETLIHGGYYTKAREVLDARLAANPFDVKSHVMLALLLMDLNEYDLAWQSARNASFIEPAAVFPAYLLASIRLRQGDTAVAKSEAQWVYEQLNDGNDEKPVRYCEEINAGQLKEVIHAGFGIAG